VARRPTGTKKFQKTKAPAEAEAFVENRV